MRDTEWSYLAGIIDGEGTITAECNGQDRIRVTISSTSTALIDWLIVKIGGHASISNRKRAEEYGHKFCWHWEVTGVKAASLLDGILPHLRIKKRQAQLALLFRETFHGKGKHPSTEDKKRRSWIVKQFRRMNNRQSSAT